MLIIIHYINAKGLFNCYEVSNILDNRTISFLGVRSYGKVVYLFFFLKFTGFLIFAAKVIDVLPLNTFKYWILETEWMEFIYNGEVLLIIIHSRLIFYIYDIEIVWCKNINLHFPSPGSVQQESAFSPGGFWEQQCFKWHHTIVLSNHLPEML